MTISSNIRKAGPFTGNGSTAAFPFYFKVFQASDLLVVQLDTATNIETTLALTTNYTVSLNADQDSNPGGTVTLVAGALAVGYKLTITSDIGNLQPTDLTNQGGFYPEVIEDSFDRSTIQIQQLAEDMSRALIIPLSSTASTSVPYPEANTVIGWNSTGTALENLSAQDLATAFAYSDWKYDVFTGDSTTTQFALQDNPGNIANLDVSLSGVTQLPGTDYTISGNILTFTTAPPTGVNILARYGQAATQTNVSYSQQVFNVVSFQTVFTLSSSYSPGNNSVAVYLNGSRLAPGLDYTETSSNTITLVRGAFAGDIVMVATATSINPTGVDAAQVTYSPAGTGAVATNVQTKLRETVSVKDFGAVGDGTTDDTAAIQAAITKASTTNGAKVFLPVGTYKVTGITVPTGVWLIGESSTPVGPGTCIIPASAAVTRMIAMTGTDAGLENLLLLGEATKAVIGVDIGHATVSDPTTPGRLTFRNVVTRLCKWGFHTLNGAFLLRWESCVGWDCLKGWYFDNTGAFLARGANIASLENCHGVSNDQHGLLAINSIAVSVDSCGFDSEVEGIRGEDVSGLYVTNTTMDLSTTASFSIIGCTFEIRGCVIDQSQLPFTIQTGTGVSKGLIKHCRTTSTVGANSVSPATTQWIDFVENTFDKSILNDGQRFGHGDRTESGLGTVSAGGSVGQLTASVTFSRAFSSLRSVQVTPIAQYTYRMNYQLSSVTTSGFSVIFTRDDGGTWSAGNTQDFYWTAIGVN